MAIVAYLEGTDAQVLTKLATHGIGTTPVSNGFDNHGKYVNHITSQDGISIVIGYLHKVLPILGIPISPRDLLHACLRHDIPVLLMAETADHD